MIEQDWQKKTELWYTEERSENAFDSWENISDAEEIANGQSAEIIGWKLLSGSWEQRDADGMIITDFQTEDQLSSQKTVNLQASGLNLSETLTTEPDLKEVSVEQKKPSVSDPGSADLQPNPVKIGKAYPGYGSVPSPTAPYPVPFDPQSAPSGPEASAPKPVESEPKNSQKKGEPTSAVEKAVEPKRSVSTVSKVPSAAQKAADHVENPVSQLDAEQAMLQKSEIDRIYLSETREFVLPLKTAVKKPIVDANVRPMTTLPKASVPLSTAEPEKAQQAVQKQPVLSKNQTVSADRLKKNDSPNNQKGQTGWQLIDGSWNYLSESTTETGWQFVDGKWQFIEEAKK